MRRGHASYVAEGARVPNPHVPRTANILYAQTVRKAWQIRSGLKKVLQVIRKPSNIPTQRDTGGMGYKLTRKDAERIRKENREKRVARLNGQEPRTQRLAIPPLYETFRSTGRDM